ncbi:MAG TPA: hypothetical protein VFG83_09440, partial [Kofleriaceae bacterium]|nr:hypothetical protein [Kofleriaceae bacterium]
DLPLEIDAHTKVSTVPSSEVNDIADIVNMTTFDIALPPHQDSTVGPLYFPVQKVEGTKFFAFGAHTHRAGKHVTVQIVDSPDAPMEADYKDGDANAFYQTRTVYNVPDFNWDNPAYVYYMQDPPNGDPSRQPVELKSGYGFRFWCDYFNNTDKVIPFGENYVDEMCYFWGYYYPSNGGLFCTYSDNTRACLGGLKPD